MIKKPEKLVELYYERCFKPSDINEHLPILKSYADRCDTITEMGLRWITSTYAFLMSGCKKLVSIDLVNPSVYDVDMNLIANLAKESEIDFKFIQGDTTKIEIEETDLLFIDTLHCYDQLKQELSAHAKKVNKFIILHDTVTFGEHGQRAEDPHLRYSNIKGINFAIQEFLEENENDWAYDKIYYNNNGLTILKRIITINCENF